MTHKIFTKEELRQMTVKQIKAIDIVDREYEAIVNEVLNEKATTVPPVIKLKEISYDPKNPTEEAEFQKEVDEFRSKNTPVEALIADAEKTLKSVKQESESVSAVSVIVPSDAVVPEVASVTATVVTEEAPKKSKSKKVNN